MPIDLLLPQGTDRDLSRMGVRAEDLGYDGVWLGELWGDNSIVVLTDIAAKTDSIGIGTAILNVFSRTPAVLAMTASSLDEVSDGRFRLGVGTSTRKAIEDLHSMDWDDPNPVRRAHETIELTKEFLDGSKRVDYAGDVFDVQDFPPLGADVPIYHAALGPANRRVVARLADGWIPHNIPFPDLNEGYDSIIETMRDEGREGSIDVAPYVPSAVADDPDVAKDTIRGHVAYYVGNGRGYERAVGQRFPEAAEAVASAWRDGDRDRAAGNVTDEMVAALGVAGEPDEARSQLESIANIACIDRPIVTIPTNADDSVVDRTIEELSPSAR